jgi:hypothetical protein
MNFRELDLCYKGERDYVHGTDIFDACMKLLLPDAGIIQNIDMSLHKIMRNQLCIVTKNQASVQENFPAIFSYSEGGTLNASYLKETEKGISCRYKYDEESVTEKAVMDLKMKTISLVDSDKFSLIEKIVAMNKKMLKSIFPDRKGKWFFTRIKLRDVSSFNDGDVHSIDIGLMRNLDFRLTDSIIRINDKVTGNIYFTMV